MIRDRFPPAPPARMLIFEESQPGRAASAQMPVRRRDDVGAAKDLVLAEGSGGPSKARAA